MRIVGEIPHSKFKITIFHMNNKYSVQFEDGEQVQNYKIPDLEELKDINGIKTLIDGPFLIEVEEIFFRMRKHKVQSIRELINRNGKEEFEHII